MTIAALQFRVGCDCAGPIAVPDAGIDAGMGADAGKGDAGTDGGATDAGLDAGSCGDGVCGPTESCAFCNADCLACPGTCTGTGTYPGCRGNGCAVCVEKVSAYTRYFTNHPGCGKNGTCAGLYFVCSTLCPAPTNADL